MPKLDRDVARILPLLMRLGHAWMRDPDLRLGQLISNALGWAVREKLYYMEDEELVKTVEDCVLKDMLDSETHPATVTQSKPNP